MTVSNRRAFFTQASLGLAAGAGALALARHVGATEPSGELGDYGEFLRRIGELAIPEHQPLAADAARVTEPNILGPYFRAGAPYRGKITPPLEPGEALVVRGRVWGVDTRQPLAGATLQIWQANAQGRYDNDDEAAPPKPGLFLNRARLTTDESGYYEYETIKPGRYQIGPSAWRPSHIHYMVSAAGYKTLVTQMYFKGDPENARDRFIRPSLIIDPKRVEIRAGHFLLGQFDVVLERA